AVVSIKPDTHVFIGERVTLRCEIQGGGSEWEYGWYKSINKFTHSTKQEIRIQSVGDSDSGDYTFRRLWDSSQRSETSDAVTLTVSAKPKATVRVNPQSSVYTGDTVTLSCELQSTAWEFQWNTINQQQLQYIEKAKTLTVTVDNEEETLYWCSARRKNYYDDYSNNYYYYDTERSDLVWITGMSSINPDKQVFSGDTVTLRCEIQDESVSRWQYSWYKDASLSPVSSVQMYTISSVEVTHTGKYTCKGRESGGSRSSHLSDAVTLTVSVKPKPVATINPDKQVFSGDTVTLRCEIQDESVSRWQYSWYKDASLSPVSSVKMYRISSVEVTHTGKYTCKGRESGGSRSSHRSDAVTLTVSGESPPVSLIISPSRTQHFTRDSLSLSCEDQSNSTGWTVRRYTGRKRVLDCSQWGSVTGCNISFLSTSYTGVYWCESESGENSNPVNITVHGESSYGDVILESSVHLVTEGHPLTLHCLYHNTKPLNFQTNFYKDGSVIQNQTTEEMIIHKVSKSDEGFYHCKHPERGESPRSWISVRRPSHVEAPFLVLVLISSVVTASPYLLITIILLVKCYRARGK
ncbi:Fc receptor-like protein 5, partial [Silurus meridionalis]